MKHIFNPKQDIVNYQLQLKHTLLSYVITNDYFALKKLATALYFRPKGIQSVKNDLISCSLPPI